MSKTFMFSCVVLVCFTCAVHATWQTGIRNNFAENPTDGYTCSYAECRQSGPGNRRFHVRCQRGQATYDCVYQGNPHTCAAYNRNQERFYNSLANKAGRGRPHACYFGYIYSDNMCRDIQFSRIIPRRGGFGGISWGGFFSGRRSSRRRNPSSGRGNGAQRIPAQSFCSDN